MTLSLLQTESERRLGTYSGLVGSADDGDTKRAKLSYMSRTSSYTRSPSSSLSGSSSLSSSSYCSPSTLTSTSGTSDYDIKSLVYSTDFCLFHHAGE